MLEMMFALIFLSILVTVEAYIIKDLNERVIVLEEKAKKVLEEKAKKE